MLVEESRLTTNDHDIGVGEQTFDALVGSNGGTAEYFRVLSPHATRRALQLRPQFNDQIHADVGVLVTLTGHRVNLSVEEFVSFFGLSFECQIFLDGIAHYCLRQAHNNHLHASIPNYTYFPMQKVENICPSMSSVNVSPVISPSEASAPRSFNKVISSSSRPLIISRASPRSLMARWIAACWRASVSIISSRSVASVPASR